MHENSLSHTRWDCSYHIIFIPKYRRKIMYKEIRKDLGEILRKLCEYKSVELVVSLGVFFGGTVFHLEWRHTN